MQKNKTMTYILFVAVIFIWGYIMYSVFRYTDSNYLEKSIHSNYVTVSEDTIKDNEYKVIPLKRDPFLGLVSTGNNNSISVQKKNKVIKQTLQNNLTTKDWSKIKYLGKLKQSNQMIQVVLISVDGNEYMIKQNEMIADYKLNKVTNDSILIQYQNENKWIRK